MTTASEPVGFAADAGTDFNRRVQAIWRIESARLIAGLARIVRDVGVAEELAQEAMLAGLEVWPIQGVPERPGAWLMLTAKRRAIDHLRRERRIDLKSHQVRIMIEAANANSELDPNGRQDQPLDDDVLRLMFIACHPVLPIESRLALALRLLAGLSVGEIARAFLTHDSTIAQRIVRAKRTLREARIPFESPPRKELADRLGSVLQVIYLLFNEGYTATVGDSWIRPALCEEALRLGRILAQLMPLEPEVHGLLALMEFQASRLRARVTEAGDPILLMDQDRGKWDRLLIRKGRESLDRAIKLGGALGEYTLQAAIAACYAEAVTAEHTNWIRILALYDALSNVAPSPIIELNRAVVVSRIFGPAEGLELLDTLTADTKLNNYHLLPSVRGELLSRLGRLEEAAREFAQAASLTENLKEKGLLLKRASACAAGSQER